MKINRFNKDCEKFKSLLIEEFLFNIDCELKFEMELDAKKYNL
jgi:hypothetical protein